MLNVASAEVTSISTIGRGLKVGKKKTISRAMKLKFIKFLSI